MVTQFREREMKLAKERHLKLTQQDIERRVIRERLPIVAVTANGKEGEFSAILVHEKAFDYCLSKPVRRADLMFYLWDLIDPK